MDNDSVTLEALAIDPADDAGTTWHPRPDKAEAWVMDGERLLLSNLDDEAVHRHIEKPESDEQVDGVRRRRRERRRPLAAEDSIETPDGEV